MKSVPFRKILTEWPVYILNLTVILMTTNFSKRSQECTVGTITRYGLSDRGIVFQIPAGTKYFPLPQNVQTGSQFHRAPCWIGTEGGRMSGILVRNSRAILVPLLPWHDFMSCARKTLPIHFLNKLKYHGKSLRITDKIQGRCFKSLMANTAV
jgi:hypothetical protein